MAAELVCGEHVGGGTELDLVQGNPPNGQGGPPPLTGAGARSRQRAPRQRLQQRRLTCSRVRTLFVSCSVRQNERSFWHATCCASTREGDRSPRSSMMHTSATGRRRRSERDCSTCPRWSLRSAK